MTPDQLNNAIRLTRAGHTPEAARLLRDIVRNEPHNIDAWKWLAYATADPREALTAIQTVRQLKPRDQWARDAWPAYQQYAQAAGITTIPRSRPSSTRAAAMLMISAILLSSVLLIALAGGRLDSIPTFMRGTVIAPLGQANPTLPATVEMHSEVEYYSFEAADIEGIQEALYTQGPQVGEAGEHSIALTNYELWVTWQMAQSVTGCRVADVVVHLDVTYTYPQWIPIGQPASLLFVEWDRFYRHVVQHEEHHGHIARQCAGQLAALLHTYQAGSVCSAAQDDLNTIVKDLYASCEARQQAFDVDYGRTTFPLPPTERGE